MCFFEPPVILPVVKNLVNSLSVRVSYWLSFPVYPVIFEYALLAFENNGEVTRVLLFICFKFVNMLFNSLSLDMLLIKFVMIVS